MFYIGSYRTHLMGLSPIATASMKIHLHTYFVVFRTLLPIIAISSSQWQMSDVLFFFAVNLQLESLFMLQKIYFNSDYVPYRPAGGWLLRIFPAVGEWLLLVVTLLPPVLMLLIISMAYLDAEMGANLYSLVAYFQNTTLNLWYNTQVWCIIAAVSFLVEHVWYLARKHYQQFVFRNFIRSFLWTYMLVFPAMILGVLMLHENEDLHNVKQDSQLFTWLVMVAKLVAELAVLRWGYWLPAARYAAIAHQIHVQNHPPADNKQGDLPVAKD